MAYRCLNEDDWLAIPRRAVGNNVDVAASALLWKRAWDVGIGGGVWSRPVPFTNADMMRCGFRSPRAGKVWMHWMLEAGLLWPDWPRHKPGHPRKTTVKLMQVYDSTNDACPSDYPTPPTLMEHNWWPAILEQMSRPLPEEAVLMDLRWWEDNLGRPNLRGLCERWGWPVARVQGLIT